jgi:hypothetical protein
MEVEMRSIHEIMNVDMSVPSPDEMDVKAQMENFAPKEDKSQGESLYDVFVKSKGDGRYVVRFHDAAIATFGTMEEGYGLMRLSIKVNHLIGGVFDDNQVSSGRLEYTTDVPQKLKSNILQLVSDMAQAGENLTLFSRGENHEREANTQI